jgi:hypothetical protein
MRSFLALLAVTGLLSSLLLTAAWAQAPAKPAPSPAPEKPAAPVRDGQADFDFIVGTWKLHNWRLSKPLVGSTTWYEFDCTAVGRKIWGGRANMDELECDTPKGHIQGLTIRTYNTQTGQWSLYWANSTRGVIEMPPVVGEFKNGVGEFFDQEMYEGRNIFVRYRWSNITPRSATWEQAFSVDGGKTWETNWRNELTRVN